MSSEWRRLSPFAILYFTFNGLSQIFSIYPLFFGGIIAIAQFDVSWYQVAVYAVALLTVIVLLSVLFYLNFSYIQQADRFLLRHGIFSKNRTELPFSKIQNISIKEPFYFRPFQLVVLKMDSAGSSTKEIALAALTRESAQEIEDNIHRTVHASASPASDEASEYDHQEGPRSNAPLSKSLILQRSTADIILHGICHNRAWFLVAILAPFWGNLEQPLVAALSAVGLDWQDFLQTSTLAILAVWFLLVITLLIVVLSALSVAGAIFALHDFKLWFQQDSYIRTSGLFTRYQLQVKKSRVQTLRYQQNWLDLITHRANVTLEPFADSGSQSTQSLMQKIVLPSVEWLQFIAMTRHLFSGFEFDQVRFQAISRIYFLRSVLFVVVPTMALVSLPWFSDGVWRIVLPLFLGVLLSSAFYLRWRRMGVGMLGHHLVVRGGLIGREYCVCAMYKVQQVQIRQSLLLKRRRLASLRLVIASRSLDIPLIPEALAREIAQLCLQQSELSARSWM